MSPHIPLTLGSGHSLSPCSAHSHSAIDTWLVGTATWPLPPHPHVAIGDIHSVTLGRGTSVSLLLLPHGSKSLMHVCLMHTLHQISVLLDRDTLPPIHTLSISLFGKYLWKPCSLHTNVPLSSVYLTPDSAPADSRGRDCPSHSQALLESYSHFLGLQCSLIGHYINALTIPGTNNYLVSPLC